MSDDATLEDFLPADGEQADGTEGAEQDGDGDVEEQVDGADEEPATATGGTAVETEPALSTSSWSSGGAACEACGEAVGRRWRDGDRLVCGDCKRWGDR